MRVGVRGCGVLPSVLCGMCVVCIMRLRGWVLLCEVRKKNIPVSILVLEEVWRSAVEHVDIW